MNSSFLENELVEKILNQLENNTASLNDRYYLKKVMSVYIYIFGTVDNILVKKYYNWLCLHWNDDCFSIKEKAEFFLFKRGIENFVKTKNQYKDLKTLSQIFKIHLKQNKESIQNFSVFFMKEIYGISKELIKLIFDFIDSPWQLDRFPLSSVPMHLFQLKELEILFFKDKAQIQYQIHIVPQLKRCASVIFSPEKKYVFLAKENDFDLFDAAFVIHEFQHLLDLSNDSITQFDTSIFYLEKKALLAELHFIQEQKFASRRPTTWLKYNLFYPILLLEYELNCLLYTKSPSEIAHELCERRGVDIQKIDSLFSLINPAFFQCSLYAAATLEIKNITKFTGAIL